jgi:hypothetical protein
MSMDDFHAWNEINGKTYDHDTKNKKIIKFYDKVALFRLKTTDYEFVHKKWTITPMRYAKHKNEILETFKEDGKELEEILYRQGWNMIKNQMGLCHSRAIMIEWKNPSAKIVYGSMGLKCKKTGKIWWEHGNGNTDYDAKVKQYTLV